MNTKILIVVALVAIIIVAGVAGAYLLIKTDRQDEIKNSPEGRFKIDISGTVRYGATGFVDDGYRNAHPDLWQINDVKYTVNRMTELDSGGLEILGFWDPWISGPVKIEAELAAPSGIKTFSTETEISSINNMWGGSEPFNLHLDMIVPNTSPFTLTFSLYYNGNKAITKVISGINIFPSTASGG
ncbi:MAG: hypothetical protein IMZ64_06215 [Bacteroidetes bacterium]|nr:hypothetical protein [Bacteroidota bacterium]